MFGQCPTAAGDATINCGSSTALVAQAAPNNGFTWSSAPCPSLPTGGTNAFPVTCDDCVTGQVPIGFTFNYFGGSYTTAVIQSNGIVGFGPFTFTGFSSFAIPAGGAPNNYIAGMFADIDIRYGGTITYQTIGVAPNRQFIVSYTNVVPYNVGTGAGTGTASFQIVLNENGSFNIIISQLSANWNASTSGALATSGCENADGTVAVPIPGRNATDWPGITPAQQDCNTFAPVTCSFLRWQQGATILSTSPTYNVSPTTSTTYTAYWNCGGSTCTDDVVITLNTTLTAGMPTNNSSCVTPNGSVPFTTTGFANGTYTLNYTLNGVPTSSSITISGGTFTLSGLNSGSYANFSITSGACSATSPGAIAITSPATPTTTGATICQGSAAATITTSSCGVPGITTAQGATFNSGALTAADPTWMRAYGGTTCSASTTSVYYDVYSFYVSTAGSYTFTGCFPAIDGYGFIYQNAFTPASACGTPANFVVGNDDSAPSCGADPMMTATLTPGVQYFLISSSFSTGATDSYSWTFTGPAAATISTSLGSSIEWYTAPTGGSSIGSTSPFNPVGVAGSGLPNTNTPGTYTFYAACSSAPTCRTATTYVISASSVPPTSIAGTGTICNGQSATLSVVGGTLATGANWNWYTGSCGGTLVGTGNSITVTPSATTTYYVGASAGTACPASGCTSGTLTLPPAGTALANNGESATCLVNQNGYIHFYHSSGRLICSINSNGQNLGNVTATAYVFGAPVNVPACNAASYMVTALGREWLINPQFQPAAGVDVVLHFDNGEYTTLAPAANANISAWDDLTGIADLKLSKYSGPLNMDNNALNNCVSAGGSGGTTLHNQAANGNTSTMLPGFSASARFARFNIPSFSEFWLHGMSGTSPLPVELSSFSASCLDGSKADIVWKTESEVNCASYVIESSRDINTWSTVGETVCTGTNSVGNTYHITDNNREVGNTYYRLIQEDTDGNKTIYGPIMLTCSSEGWSITSHPNPADEVVTLMINSEQKKTTCVIELFDFTGKLIKTQVVNSTSYQTLVPLDVKELSAGPYSIRVTSDENKVETLKVIVQH